MAEEQTVQIKGAVRSSGTYNYRNDMTLEDLILQAEGFTDAASEARIEISRRISGDGDPESSSDEIAEIYSLGITRDLQLQEEDRMFRLKPLDRKSTRLNSSHVAISYAVFCLKKKKEPKPTKGR